MNDIKKSSHSLRYKSDGNRVPIIRSGIEHANINHSRLLNKKVKAFESASYEDENDELVGVSGFYRKEKKETFNNIRNRNLKSANGFKFSTKTSLLIASLLGLALIFFTLTFIFNSATVTVVQKVQDVTANDTFIFSNTENSEAYQIIEIKKEVSKPIERSITKSISSKSFGNITIYNNYSDAPQKLVKNTRFESLGGKIFRISDSVTVPGKTSSGPGAVTVSVTADANGPEYNIKSGRFTIPGFKGSPRYTGFYGESKSAMKGGENGKTNSFSRDEIDNTDMQLRSEIRELIKKDLSSIYKKNFSPIYDPSLISYTNNQEELLKTKDNKYTVFAVGKIILLKDDFLAKELAKKYLTKYSDQDVTLKDLSKLKLELATSTLTEGVEKISIKVTGTTSIVMNINQDALKNELVNKNNNQTDFNAVLSKFTEINQAVPKISPFWSKTFPKNINKIDIIIKDN